MAVELRYPNITGRNEYEMLEQIKSYLYQLVQQLQFALSDTNGSSQGGGSSYYQQTIADPVAAFNSLKPLIIASTEIVQTYGDKILDLRLAKQIRTGILYKDGDEEVRGVELGNTKVVDGEDVFVKVARFTEKEVTFYRDGEEIYSLRADDEWIDLGLSENVSESTVDMGRNGSGCYYRRLPEKGHYRIAFNCAFLFTGSPIRVNAELIPEADRPSHSICAACATSIGFARAMVTTGGEIYIESSLSSGTHMWIDGYIEY